MVKIFWGFYLHVEGMKLGTSASVKSGPGGVSVSGPTYNLGGTGSSGCFFAANIGGSKKIYPVRLDSVSVQGMAVIRPAAPQEDNIDLNGFGRMGNTPLLTNSRLEIQVHQFYSRGNHWIDVPINIKLNAPFGTGTSKGPRLLLSRNGLISLKGAASTAATLRGTLGAPLTATEMGRWDACFGR